MEDADQEKKKGEEEVVDGLSDSEVKRFWR